MEKNYFKNIKIKFKRIFKKKRKKGMWQGDFQSWNEAQSMTTGYDSEIILEKCKNALLKVKSGEAVYERDSVLFDSIQYSWALLCCLQKVAIENKNSLNIIDFGGSLGSTYYQNINMLQNLNSIKWCIIEQSHFVSCGKEYFEDDQLFFQENFSQALDNFTPNVVLLSSVLQYLEDPKYWVKYVSELKIPYIIIDRTAIANFSRDIITVQNVKEEIYQASYPCWFFNENKLLNFFENYEVIFDFDSFCDFPLKINDDTEVFWKGYLLKLKS